MGAGLRRCPRFFYQSRETNCMITVNWGRSGSIYLTLLHLCLARNVTFVELPHESFIIEMEI